MDNRLTEDMRTFVHDEGAALVGIGDLTALPAEARRGMPRGIVFALPLDPAIAASLVDGPSPSYAAEYERLNARLQALGEQCAAWLTARGYQAINQGVTVEGLDRQTLSMLLPHKTVATRAGLGWVGKCALLVTDAYGSALRISSVLTDAPLTAGTPIDASCCGDCSACRDACPTAAPTGARWHAGLPREALYDAFACFRGAREQAALHGSPHIICGRCIAACPWTQRYLERSTA
jgi:epoxyqueuosine reductase QueG